MMKIKREISKKNDIGLKMELNIPSIKKNNIFDCVALYTNVLDVHNSKISHFKKIIKYLPRFISSTTRKIVESPKKRSIY